MASINRGDSLICLMLITRSHPYPIITEMSLSLSSLNPLDVRVSHHLILEHYPTPYPLVSIPPHPIPCHAISLYLSLSSHPRPSPTSLATSLASRPPGMSESARPAGHRSSSHHNQSNPAALKSTRDDLFSVSPLRLFSVFRREPQDLPSQREPRIN